MKLTTLNEHEEMPTRTGMRDQINDLQIKLDQANEEITHLREMAMDLYLECNNISLSKYTLVQLQDITAEGKFPFPYWFLRECGASLDDAMNYLEKERNELDD